MPYSHIKIEFSKDGGRTWKTWVFYKAEQMIQCRQQLCRMMGLYPEWEFRIVQAVESDAKQLRKLLKLQNVIKR